VSERVIVQCGIRQHYEAEHRASRAACEIHCQDADLLFYSDYPPGCPPQDQRMYAFKIYALAEALARGYRFLLWMDTSFSPVAAIDPLWESIEQDGWYVPGPQGQLGNWCSDSALGVFGIDRATAHRIDLVYSGIVGLDMQHPIGCSIWQGWKDLYGRGTFDGPHINKPGEPMQPWGQKWQGHVSHDPNVFGHRHDEAALSFVLYRLGLLPHGRGLSVLDAPQGPYIIGRTQCR
jgi:hypothetical protein